jgi:maleylpyruvate isomerase
LVACEIHPLNNLRTLQHLKRALGQNEEQINTWYRHWIADGFAKLEADLNRDKSGGGTGRFCHGDSPTMADCCLVPQVFNARRYSADLGPYPTLMRIFDACMKLEAFDRAQPSKQPDAE